ncbi:sugar transporter [Shewanella corallii]|uniref:Sugar transporter n=1 Tax=Shewanella corallii TaxID=560080 RepID=A0ABT0N1Q8_9GAMM|nr:sugar transporter [Shewanella corallii]MCL2912369.1 sugar transporter [Shewanella corallii]
MHCRICSLFRLINLKMQAQPNTMMPWVRVFLLALAAFIFNTTEFVPVGMLGNLGDSFGMRPEEVGPMLTIYAWIVALASLPAMLLLANVERRRLLLCVFALFVGSHIVSAMASSYSMLLVSRVGIALAHSVFWSITAAMAVRLAPQGKSAQALGLLATGTVLAMVLGIPLGRVVGEWFGWRATFAGIGITSALVMLALWRWLPTLPVSNSGSLASLPQIARNKPLLWLYLLTVIVVTAHFTGYTYLEPLVQQVWHYSGDVTTWVLLAYGAAGIVGSTLFSRLQPKHPNNLLVVGTALLALCLAMLSSSAPALTQLIPGAMLWGIAMMLVALAMQARVLEYGASATDIAMAIYSGIFNIGIGGGALLGSQVAIHWGVTNNGLVAVGVIAFAIIPLRYLLRRGRTDNTDPGLAQVQP